MASSSALVGRSGEAAAGKLPKRMRLAINSKRALVAVRFRPAMNRSTGAVKPSLLPRPTHATGMPLHTARSRT
jgi:hypothetical protein